MYTESFYFSLIFIFLFANVFYAKNIYLREFLDKRWETSKDKIISHINESPYEETEPSIPDFPNTKSSTHKPNTEPILPSEDIQLRHITTRSSEPSIPENYEILKSFKTVEQKFQLFNSNINKRILKTAKSEPKILIEEHLDQKLTTMKDEPQIDGKDFKSILHLTTRQEPNIVSENSNLRIITTAKQEIDLLKVDNKFQTLDNSPKTNPTEPTVHNRRIEPKTELIELR